MHNGVLLKKSSAENSTQRLLDLIRSDEELPLEDPSPQTVPIPEKIKKKPIKKRRIKKPGRPPKTRAKNLTAGVWISPRDITVVLTAEKSRSGPRELVEWHCFPMEAGLTLEADAFPQFLGQCLGSALGKRKRIPIWCALESGELTMKNMLIPNLAHAKIANAAFWGLKKETEFDETNDIYSFEILGDQVVDGVKKKNLLVFSAPKKEVDRYTGWFQKAGYPLTGLTSVPFASGTIN